MRDKVDLSSEDIQNKVKQGGNEFITEYKKFIKNQDILDKHGHSLVNDYIIDGLYKDLKDVNTNKDSIMRRIKLLENMMDEDFEVEDSNSSNATNSNEVSSDVDATFNKFDIDTLLDSTSNIDTNSDGSTSKVDTNSADSTSDIDADSEEFDIDMLADSTSDIDTNSEEFDIDMLADSTSDIDANSEEFDIDMLADSTSNTSYDNNLPSEILDGLNYISELMGAKSPEDIKSTGKFILDLRSALYREPGRILLGKLRSLSDLFVADFSQPSVLRELDNFEKYMLELETPKPYSDDTKPVGIAVGIQDLVKTLYKVFYHNDEAEFEKIPDVLADGFNDKSLTDRSIVSVCINQIQASDSERLRQFVTTDLKTSQLMITVKGDGTEFNKDLLEVMSNKLSEIFPPDHPYVESVDVSGRLIIFQKMNERLMSSQIVSVSIALVVVFIICSLILKSLIRGFISVLPLTMTVIINLGLMGFLGIPIKEGSLLISAIGIGAGIDYTIHFVQRYKTEYIKHNKGFKDAYLVTINTTGKAIIFNAFSVAGGFLVLAFSNFKMLSEIGLLLGIVMILTSLSALTLLPSLLKLVGERFFGKTLSVD